MAKSNELFAVPGHSPADCCENGCTQSRPVYAVGGIGDGVVPAGVGIADGDKSGAVPGDAIAPVGKYRRTGYARPVYAVGGVGDGVGALADGDINAFAVSYSITLSIKDRGTEPGP